MVMKIRDSSSIKIAPAVALETVPVQQGAVVTATAKSSNQWAEKKQQ